MIAWRERVHDRGFPSTCPTGGKNKNLSVSSIKYLLHPFETLATQAGEFFAAVVNRRTVDCSKDAIWNIRRPWNLEKMPACFVGWREEVPSASVSVSGGRVILMCHRKIFRGIAADDLYKGG
jgi:hypothetical protein